MDKRSVFWKCLFVFACALALLLQVVPGRLAHVDEVFFKCAGLHWAQTGHFAAPEIVGRVDVTPGLDEVYFAQPPLYSFVFGIYTKLMGFGPHRCILFDALIHILLASLIVLLGRRLFELPVSGAYSAGALALFLGTQGRPDELGICFALCGMLALTLELSSARRAVLCGAAFGLCLATSLGACLFLSPLALVAAHHRRMLTFSTIVRATVCGVMVALLCVAPILASHPLAYRQLTAHAADQSAQMGKLLANGAPQAMSSPSEVPAEHSFLKTMLHSEATGVVFAMRFGREIVAAVTGCLLLIALCAGAMPRDRASFWKQGTVVAFCAMTILWLMMPGKYTYLWFFGPWLLCLTTAVLMHSYQALGTARRIAIAVVAFASVSVFGMMYGRDRLIFLALPREQAFYQNMEHVRATIPAGARVVTGEYWWALADKCNVLDPMFSHPKVIDVDYVVKTGNGSGAPGKPALFADYYEAYAREQHLAVLEDDLNRAPLSFHGVRITNSAWGFGPMILGRNATESRKTQAAAGQN